jgi:hypothetical protein
MCRLLLAFALLALVTAPTAAHHSFALYYVEDDTIEVEGEVVKFEYKNPHSWVYLDGQEGLSARRVYAAEWSGTSRLESDGIDKNFLKPGDRLRIWASPNRNPTDTRIRLKRIRRSDGWTWGANPRDTR